MAYGPEVESPNVRLRNAPIIEAMIELRAEFAVEVGLEELATFREQVTRQYSRSEVQVERTTRIPVAPQAQSASSPPKQVGYLLRSDDGFGVVQARIDGLRFSRLAPYEHWEPFAAELKRLWAIYVETLKPIAITRVGVRFINRISLPSPVNLNTYLNTRPEIAAPLEQELAEYFFRMAVPITATSVVVMTQLTEPAPKDKTSLILDIEAVENSRFTPGEEGIWKALSALRSVKNRFFFESVTNQVVELAGGVR